jgi:ribosome biogenesis GTPase
LPNGLIIKSTGSWYKVRSDSGQITDCRVKGKFRIKGYRLTNPLSVGDRVFFETEDTTRGIISKIEKRKNYIIRRSPHAGKYSLLAANIDQVFLMITLVKPKTSLGFIDRFLVGAAFFNIPCVLVFNKADLYAKGELLNQDELMKLYARVGYKTISISCLDKSNIELVEKKMSNKVTLVAGHSGVGKSSLINCLLPGVNRKVGEISQTKKKGVHTTTFSELLDLPGGGYLIDSPGIREFGIAEIESETELSSYFYELERLSGGCMFNDCLHENEPDCAVKNALQSNDIAESRYVSYLKLLDEVRKIKAY